MISREQVSKLKELHQEHKECADRELLDTLDTALKVIDKIKKLYNSSLADDEFIVAVGKALAPFTAPRGKE